MWLEAHFDSQEKKGELLVFGDNGEGQLGMQEAESVLIPKLLLTNKEIKQICCGEQHSLFLTQQGEVWSFGYNALGKYSKFVFFPFEKEKEKSFFVLSEITFCF